MVISHSYVKVYQRVFVSGMSTLLPGYGIHRKKLDFDWPTWTYLQNGTMRVHVEKKAVRFLYIKNKVTPLAS